MDPSAITITVISNALVFKIFRDVATFCEQWQIIFS